jgi:PPE-repeat protein
MVRAVTAGVGTAPTVGALSVPPGWATATPAIRLAATSLPAAGSTVAAPSTGAAGLLNPAALGALTGGALGAPGSQLINGANIRGGVPKGGKGQAPVQLDRVLAQLQKQKDAVQHWQIDEAGLDGLLEELSKKPGFHAVHLKKAAKGAGATGSAAAATAIP